ncbi:cell division protein FtsA [Gorillibacterium massiliense]|uniref:cell division protein FtsA n=1 Tax=Gorillibacterium massiliense TaxID=1280390 RepID=UPI0004B6E476|nr:cell division protein FtsA [Gorillibacterium massiliense]
MGGNEVVVSLDIGTSKVRAIIGEVSNGSINIIGVGTAESEGIRKGSIVDIDQTVQSIKNAIEHAERMVDIQINEVFVGISGNHISLLSSHGVVAVSNEDREIGEDDIERVLQASRVIALPPEREIIGVVAKQFVVDGLNEIHDPRGMIGVRLEVEATIITGAKTAIHNLKRVVEKADLRINGLVLMSLAAGNLSLSKDEKTIGTVLVDIGAGSTTIAVFEHGTLMATSTLPIGGDLITSDISIGLHTQMEHAERVKLKFGCSQGELAARDQVFKVPRIGSNSDKEYSQVDLTGIIEPRVQEMFQLIRTEVYHMGYGNAPGGYVLTGGTVSMPGLLATAQKELGTSVRVGSPDFIGVRDPSYTSGVGIISHIVKSHKNRSHSQPQGKTVVKKATAEKSSWFEKFKNWISEYI